MEQPGNKAKPEVLIIGAGIGGLMMALLLEQIGIPYHIYERDSEVTPIGSAMVFAGHKLAIIEQLGLYEDLLQVAKPIDSVAFYQGDGKQIGQFIGENCAENFGYDDLVFSRPDFYKILRRRIPNEKISYKKKILATEEKEGKVTIHCSDNTSHTGDILIGADGAYSRVRQSLFKEMESKGLLPKEDLEDFSIGYTVVVGVSKCDPKKYPMLEQKRGKFNQIIFNGDSNCYVATLPGNQIAWGLGTQIPRTESKKSQSHSSEWSVDSSESSIKPFRDFASPVGGTMGEIFDSTPKELISKVHIEEKIFKTWHHGRTVLIGDAIHKLHPAGGQGAANAIHDAAILANCLYAMKDNSEKSIHAAFADYYDQRFSHAEEEYTMSSFMSKILNGQTIWEKLLRKVVLSYIPLWVFEILAAGVTKYRPQVAWLPLVRCRGTRMPDPQIFEKNDANAVSL
ncbi:hypothetical protein BGZ76_003212 [Entomortierella beljakovae]|nr:hypothetical protein BGZ76_003212 [Entomortierella beljakovae]